MLASILKQFLPKHGRQILADPENNIFVSQISRTLIDRALSPWPPVELLTAFLAPLRLQPPIESLNSVCDAKRVARHPAQI